jgi:hypothetical protein
VRERRLDRRERRRGDPTSPTPARDEISSGWLQGVTLGVSIAWHSFLLWDRHSGNGLLNNTLPNS